MKPNRHIQNSNNRLGQPEESGVALITVLALLSIFAVVLVGFTYSIRVEEYTLENYKQNVNVVEATEAATQGVLGQVARDVDPANPKLVLGRPQPHYVSLLDPWAVGYAGWVGSNVSYDARSHLVDIRSPREFDRTGFKIYPTPIPLGVDEDPPGDLNRDGAPGLRGIDDNLDGITDPEGDGLFADDDEDFLIDEDGYDLRRGNDGLPFAPGTGYDLDGDRLGVFDENSKININFAGNNFNSNGSFVYNQGVGPHELDLPVFIYNRVVRYRNASGGISTLNAALAENVAQAIVSTRYGNIDGTPNQNFKPGVNNDDDNNNNNPNIVNVQEYSQAMSRVRSFDGEPWAVVGNSLDDDNDGLFNEEDERYIGPTTDNSSGNPLQGPINNDNVEQFRPGNRVDDDGDGYIDEQDEGVDEPAEFDIFRPRGDDRPFASVDDLKLVQGMRTGQTDVQTMEDLFPSMFDILSQSTTIYSHSDQISGPLSGKNNEIGKINPNIGRNWQAVDVWDELQTNRTNQADFQYSPPVDVEDLIALQVDNDGDWQLEAEIDVQNGQPNGIDDDGDGLIDEPSDDWDGNFFPSPDFDGFGESDVNSPGLTDGIDSDGDGFIQDENRRSQDFDGPLRILPVPNNDDAINRPRDEQDNQIRPGFVAEGNGRDDDGDGIIDDTGDFNGDGLLSYDPEWHVNEDAWGDLSADGYPGLGAPIEEQDEESAEGDIISRLDTNDDRVVTNFADDDWDGYADFYDPQVLAAMYAPELDGVDNDSDGEVDEIGERYIAVFDDDEDGRYDEDPPEFQIALNMIDFIDTFMPFSMAQDDDIRQILSLSQDDPVLSDPVTIATFNLYNTRQRAFRMHPRILAGPNPRSNDQDVFDEYMRLLMPNPPQQGMETTFYGVEAIRINEVFAKPFLRLEAEDVIERLEYQPGVEQGPKITLDPKGNAFRVTSGQNDDGLHPEFGVYDSNWGPTSTPTTGAQDNIPRIGSMFLPEGFRNTLNPFMPIANADTLAPAFIFSVTQVKASVNPAVAVGRAPEVAEWVFNNIPNGVYDFALYMHPNHLYSQYVQYFFNGQQIPLISDTDGLATGTPADINRFRRNMAHNSMLSNTGIVNDAAGAGFFPLNYRLTPRVTPDQENVRNTDGRIVVNNNQLTVTIQANNLPEDAPQDFYETSFDRIDLFNPRIQYVELVNLSQQDIDLTGWTINTPYGHYIFDDSDTTPVIPRLKPSYTGDDGQPLQSNEGFPGLGVPHEQLLLSPNNIGSTLNTEDYRLEDNKLLLAFDKQSLTQYINDHFPTIENIQDRIIEPVIDSNTQSLIQNSAQSGTSSNPKFVYSQVSDQRFRVVDIQEDMLVQNPSKKMITLHDPAGNYIDSFEYKTTFNQRIVNIPTNPGASAGGVTNFYDLVAVPGAKGFESFERDDPTHFRTEMVTEQNGSVSGAIPPHWGVSGSAPAFDMRLERKTPSNIRLDAKDAIIARVELDNGDLERTAFGGYTTGNDPNGTNLTRFKDNLSQSIFPLDQQLAASMDSFWNGWDFIGDYYQYERDNRQAAPINELLEAQNAAAWEAALIPRANMLPSQIDSRKAKFFSMLGGFENFRDVNLANPDQADIANNIYTAFTWRLGLRELIRAGYDPEVDDQLTVRVLGRNATDLRGRNLEIPLPVGEVLVLPPEIVLNPGDVPLNQQPQTVDNENNPYYFSQGNNGTNLKGYREPVFAKLFHGDTAFTIDLRDSYNQLWNDLRNTTGDEPMVEITVVMRKTTSNLGPEALLGNIDNQIEDKRPDLIARFGSDFAVSPLDGAVMSTQGGSVAEVIGTLGQDNYFFKGIELFGRGRASNNDSANSRELRRYLAGTPGRDNTGYVPAYPRRRLDQQGTQRDQYDIIDNTPYIKNGLLSTLGEISRIHTGNKFETINTPIIPQRLEDNAMSRSRVHSNPELARRSTSNMEMRIQLAQRERLDQYENQYMHLYNMITTSMNGIVPGLININTAPREVLAALPSAPLDDIGQLRNLNERFEFNSIVADYIIEGRQPGGHDYHFGMHELDDDLFVTDFLNKRRMNDNMSEFKFHSVGREPNGYKDFDDIDSLVFSPLNIVSRDVKDDTIQFNDVNTSTIVFAPDDGPYSDIGTLLSQITHLRRRERLSAPLMRPLDRTFDGKVDGIGDLRERLNDALNENLTPEDMEALMNRISNLITVRSRTFEILTRGRVYDRDGNITAQRRLQSVYER